VLTVTSVCGNMFHDKEYESPGGGAFERLRVSRLELEKSRIRRSTDGGTDVGIALVPGRRLRHGDVLSGGGKTIVVEQLPEKVISVRLKDGETPRVEPLVLIGHVIGNRHRPVSVKDGVISFPIQSESELEVFEKMFAGVLGCIELSVEETVFDPHAGADVHEH